MINLDLIVGARPNFMKIAPIIKAIEKHNLDPGTLNLEHATQRQLAWSRKEDCLKMYVYLYHEY